MSDTVLVTGAAGFIGSHLAERLLRDGYRVVGLDEFNDYYDPRIKRENFAAVRAAGPAELIEGDIRDAALCRRALETWRPAVIVHLAARAGVRPSLVDPILYEQVNCCGTINLLEAARAVGGVRRFVFASSSSVYGVSPRVPFREDDPEIEPISPYGVTKRAGELHCRAYSRLYGLSCVCLRFFTVYGPRQRPDMAIHKFARLIEAGRELPVFGDGRSIRDYTYYEDVLQGILGAMNVDTPFDIFNLGESRTVELSHLIRLLEEALGRKALLKWLPDAPGDVPQTFADISKARRLLGYAPAFPIEEGVRRFAAWLRRPTAT
ncbi:MAG: GDP-mannose 4,6-dehydratase [Planctomycetes bacterium]|nr:GDP-mannose 4,6-dehydratase [Planctomycetota bacterium]